MGKDILARQFARLGRRPLRMSISWLVPKIIKTLLKCSYCWRRHNSVGKGVSMIDNSVGKEVLPNKQSRTLLKQLELMFSGGGWVVDSKENRCMALYNNTCSGSEIFLLGHLFVIYTSKDQVFPVTPRRTDSTNYVNTLWHASEPFPTSRCP